MIYPSQNQTKMQCIFWWMLCQMICRFIWLINLPAQTLAGHTDLVKIRKEIPEKIPCPVITLLINLHLCGSGGDVPSRALLGHEAARGSARPPWTRRLWLHLPWWGPWGLAFGLSACWGWSPLQCACGMRVISHAPSVFVCMWIVYNPAGKRNGCDRAWCSLLGVCLVHEAEMKTCGENMQRAAAVLAKIYV